MRQIILDQINHALSVRRTYFTREQDIQLYLASYLLNTNFYNNVFIEYHVPGILVPPYLLSDESNSYIDIVLEKDNEFYPVEISYKTSAQPLQRLVFGQNVNILLTQNSAQNIGCYDFWKDVKRIEFYESNFPLVKRGVVLFVSNDMNYQHAPSSSTAGYAPFSIYKGRQVAAGTLLNWNGNTTVANRRPGFAVNYDYNINWVQLPFDQQHYYVLI